MKSILRANLPLIFTLLSKCKAQIQRLLVLIQSKYLIENIIRLHKDNINVEEVLSFLRKNSLHMVPYYFIKDYVKKDIDIHLDNISGFRYVKYGNHLIYFPLHMSNSYIKEAVINAYIEQDKRSPHKYLPIDDISIGGDIAILCGASDGIYTLEIAEYFNKIYLFEADPRWVEPLKLTLKDILHKVEIVPLFISNEDSKGYITLDSFMNTKEGEVNYLQADIEDAELKMLMGATNLLTKSNNLKMSICCYHTPHQEADLTSYLNKFGFKTSTSKGFLLLWMQFPLRPPYLRKGVIYAQKSNL